MGTEKKVSPNAALIRRTSCHLTQRSPKVAERQAIYSIIVWLQVYTLLEQNYFAKRTRHKLIVQDRDVSRIFSGGGRNFFQGGHPILQC